MEVKNQGAGDWSELSAQCQSTSYRVRSGLQPQQDYCFRVRAYNEVGVSQPGPVSAVVRMEQKGEARLGVETKSKYKAKCNEACVTAVVSVCACLEKQQEEESPQAFTCVTIDSSHKVSDHYNMQEKLGM